MTDIQLYTQIAGLPDYLKQEVSDFVSFLQQKHKIMNSENEQSAWQDFSANNFLKGYGEDEPDYTEGDVKEPNPEYKIWKGK